MGDIFRHFLNDCANNYGKIIEANLYSSGFATIKVETEDNKVLELSVRLNDVEKEEENKNAETI